MVQNLLLLFTIIITTPLPMLPPQPKLLVAIPRVVVNKVNLPLKNHAVVAVMKKSMIAAVVVIRTVPSHQVLVATTKIVLMMPATVPPHPKLLQKMYAAVIKIVFVVPVPPHSPNHHAVVRKMSRRQTRNLAVILKCRMLRVEVVDAVTAKRTLIITTSAPQKPKATTSAVIQKKSFQPRNLAVIRISQM